MSLGAQKPMEMEKLRHTWILLLLFTTSVFEKAEAATLGQPCNAESDDCTGANVVCNTNCVCENGFTVVAGACKTNKGFGEECSMTTDKCTADGTACVVEGTGTRTTTKCLCAGEYVTNGNNDGCLRNLGGTCESDEDCGEGVCDITRTTKVCAVAIGEAGSCQGTDADNCVLNAECTSNTCSCKSGYTATSNLCIGEIGSACETSTGCGENNVCDTNANSAVCALASNGDCSVDSSKCMTYSECTDNTCTCTFGNADETTELCPAPRGDLGGTCESDDDCGEGVCDITRTTKVCAVGAAGSCEATDPDNCVSNAECTRKTCTCKSGYTATGKHCIGDIGSKCETSTGCGENNVCDTNANSAVCALGSDGDCGVEGSKCMTYAECTDDTCACTFGNVDDTTELCPAPSRGLRGTSSMLVVAVGLLFVLVF